MKADSHKDERCLTRSQVPWVVVHEHRNPGCLIFMTLLLAVLFTCTIDYGHAHADAQVFLVSVCPASSDATATPTPTLILLPTPPSSPTPSPSPDQVLIEERVWQYIVFLVDGQCLSAYRMLSVDVQAQEPYAKFIEDMEYTLLPGCWIINSERISQFDGITWDDWIEMTQVSCDTHDPIAFFSWHIRMQMQGNQLVITSIGLYPSGAGN